MTRSASANIGLASVGDDFRHRWMVTRMPVGREEKVTRLFPTECGVTARE
jgi:hypothetical protein